MKIRIKSMVRVELYPIYFFPLIQTHQTMGNKREKSLRSRSDRQVQRNFKKKLDRLSRIGLRIAKRKRGSNAMPMQGHLPSWHLWKVQLRRDVSVSSPALQCRSWRPQRRRFRWPPSADFPSPKPFEKIDIFCKKIRMELVDLTIIEIARWFRMQNDREEEEDTGFVGERPSLLNGSRLPNVFVPEKSEELKREGKRPPSQKLSDSVDRTWDSLFLFLFLSLPFKLFWKATNVGNSRRSSQWNSADCFSFFFSPLLVATLHTRPLLLLSYRLIGRWHTLLHWKRVDWTRWRPPTANNQPDGFWIESNRPTKKGEKIQNANTMRARARSLHQIDVGEKKQTNTRIENSDATSPPLMVCHLNS